MITQKAELMQAALEYARHGWRVFPCLPGGKQPVTGLRWRNEATTDEATIRRWWKRWPEANIGIATGGTRKGSGVVVLDVDGEAGERSLRELEEAYGPLPRTLEARTGGGGRHIFFKAPDFSITNSINKIGRKLDIRGDGGYIVAPPSIHKSGKRYEWITTSEPAELPAWLAALIKKTARKKANRRRKVVKGRVWENYLRGPEIPEGTRDVMLFKIACSMRAKGAGYEDILATLLRINAERCSPPLEYGQVEQKAAQAIKYAPGKTSLLDYEPSTWGNAERMAVLYEDDLKYCEDFHGWLVWDGFRWVPDKTGEVQRRAMTVIRAFQDQVREELARKRQELAGSQKERIKNEIKELEKLLKFAKQSENRHNRNNMIADAASHPGIAVADPEEFDKDHWLLNVENGTIDLKTGELRPHQRGDMITKMAGTYYDPDAECPRWEQFLREVMNDDEELIQYLQKAIGYSLTGDTSAQEWYLLYGTGANGKSVFLSTIQELLGDYAQQAPSSLLMAKKEMGPTNDLARLKGARFVAATETDEGRRIAEGLVKQLTGDDKVSARFLFKETFEFKPTAKLWLATNHKPVVRGTDYGFWRRVRLIPFTRQFAPEERDTRLPEKLRKELPGILRWAVEGARLYRQEGMQVPDKVRAATAEYQAESDVIGAFIADCCVLNPLAKVPVSELYHAYTSWCSANGEPSLSQRIFGKRLKERGDVEQVKGSKGVRMWKGIGLTAAGRAEAAAAKEDFLL